MEQRYRAVLAVIGDGVPVTEVASRFGVSRQTLHAWLGKYEAGGVAALADRSHAVKACPHQMSADVEVLVVSMRLAHPGWGPRRIEHELARAGVAPMPSRSGIYRALKRAGLIDPDARRRRAEKFKRWERGGPMELWQMDIVGGVLLADGSTVKESPDSRGFHSEVSNDERMGRQSTLEGQHVHRTEVDVPTRVAVDPR